MLSYFSPILDHCSGRPERLTNPSAKSTPLRAKRSENPNENFCSFREFRLPIQTFCDILVI